MAHRQRDRVGIITFDDDIVDYVPVSAKHFDVLLHTLDRSKPQRAGNLIAPVNKMAEHFKRRSVLALISDFYEEPDIILEAIKPLRFLGNDLMVFHVLDRAEIEFNYDDASSFEDLESGEQIPIVPEALSAQYRALMQEHIDALDDEVLRAPDRLHDAEHVHAARPRAVHLSGMREKMMRVPVKLSDASLPDRRERVDDSGADPPDSARTQTRRRVPVADVPAAHSRISRCAGAAFAIGSCCACGRRRCS